MISQFSFDWVSRNWYFMDLLNNFIFVCSSEMKYCRIIVRSTRNDTAKLRHFAIDPDSGYLFLTKHDPRSRVGASVSRSLMDGSSLISLLTDKMFYPNDLTLDIAMKKIYFLDHYFDFIQQCDYDGGNRQFLQKLPLMKFHRIAFFENTFYGAVNKNISVVRVSKSLTTLKKVLAENLEAHPKIVKIFHQQVQPTLRNPHICSTSHNCEHLCVPMLESSRIVEKCLCREGFKLENGKCKLRDSKKFIMYVEDYPRTLKAVDIDGVDEQVIAPIIGLKTNIAFDVDLTDKVIFFTSYSDLNSSENGIIEYHSFNGSNQGILKGSFGAVQSISYDWVGKNLYFTSQTPKTRIAAVKRDFETQEAKIKTLISKNLIGPCSLALDPENGKINRP